MKTRGRSVTILLLLAVLLLTANAYADSGTLARAGGASTPLNAEGTPPYGVELMPLFNSAAARHGVPVQILLALGYLGSGFENRGMTPNRDGGYGVMALRENILSGVSLGEASDLLRVSKNALIANPAANIEGAAAVLDYYSASMRIDRNSGMQAWLGPVIKYAGFDEEDSKFFAYEVFKLLGTGLDKVNSTGERIAFEPQDIGSIDLESLKPANLRAHKPGGSGVSREARLCGFSTQSVSVLSTDYGPAIWDPAASCNYSTATHGNNTIVIHVMDGSLAGTRAWFKNCAADCSAQYCIGTDGTVVQMVRENQTAWHASCANSTSIGIEHEGYASDASHPQALYDASAALCKSICERWGIPKQHTQYYGGIMGHIDVTNHYCGDHTDPGAGWNWNYFIGKINSGDTTPEPVCQVIKNSDARLELFYRGLDGALYHGWQTAPNGTTWNYGSLGGAVNGLPVVATWADGRMDVFLQGSDGGLWHTYQLDGWWSSQQRIANANNVVSRPSVVRNSANCLEVFYRRSDNVLCHAWQSAPNSSTYNVGSIGGSVASAPIVAKWADGRMDVFYRATNNQLYHTYQSNGWWTSPISLGGSLQNAPCVGMTSDNRLEVFARGADNGLYHAWQTGQNSTSFNGMTFLTGSTVNIGSAPSVGKNIDGRLEVFYRGTDNALWHIWQWNGWWSSAASLGGILTSAPIVGFNDNGAMDVFERDLGGGLDHMYQTNGWWSSYYNVLPGITIPANL